MDRLIQYSKISVKLNTPEKLRAKAMSIGYYIKSGACFGCWLDSCSTANRDTAAATVA
jgi:hypothetical protein